MRFIKITFITILLCLHRCHSQTCTKPAPAGTQVNTGALTYTNDAGSLVNAPTGTEVQSCNTNYIWADGNTGTKAYTCTAASTWTPEDANMNCVAVCTKPPTLGSQVSATLSYTGELGASHVQAPSGTAVMSCNANHIWSDGTTSTKSLTCTAANTWSVSPDCVPVCTTPPAIGTQVSGTISYTATLGTGYVQATTGTATLSCNANHIWSDGATGTKTLTCTAANTWDASLNCEPVCTKPPTLGTQVSGTITYASELGTSFVQAPAGTATLSCNTNHVWASDASTGTKAITCTAAATWQASPNCAPVCTYPPTLGAQVDSGTISYTSTLGASYVTAPGGTATLTCMANHIWSDGATGGKTIVCQAAETWQTSPYCVPVCTKPPTLGTQVSTTVTYTGELGLANAYVLAPSGTATISCNSGYVWSDGATSTKSLGCTAANTWDASLNCVAACTKPPPIGSQVSTTITYTNELGTAHVTAGTGTAVVGCNAHHIWSDGTTGTKTLTCTALNTWSSSLDCVPVCTQPPATGMYVDTTPTSYTGTIGTGYVQAPSGTAVLQCMSGYLWSDGSSGTKTVTCTAANTWTGSYACIAVCTTPPSLGTQVSSTVSYTGAVGTAYVLAPTGTAILKCNDGYVWADGYGCETKSITCQALSTWETSPSCITPQTVTSPEPCAVSTTTAVYYKRVGNRKDFSDTWYILIANGGIVFVVLIGLGVFAFIKTSQARTKEQREDRVTNIERI